MGATGRSLETFRDPILSATWGELGAVRRMANLNGKWHAEVRLGYPVGAIERDYARAVSDWLADPGDDEATRKRRTARARALGASR